MTAACLSKREWPSGNHRIWEELAKHLRPDHIGPKERQALFQMLETEVVRRRVIQLLKERVDVYRNASKKGGRGFIERETLLKGIKPRLENDAIDKLINCVIKAVDIYERTSSLFQQAFDGLVWVLKFHGGRGKPEDLLEDSLFRPHLEETRMELGKVISLLDQSIEQIRAQTSLNPLEFCEPISKLKEEAVASSVSSRVFVETILQRHEKVQKDKKKAFWIDRESQWTLMPGENRISGNSPPKWQDMYLHPFKISNAYSLLKDLGQVNVEDSNGEE